MDDLFDGYTPFGPEWEKEMMKFPKKKLIEMFRETKTIPVECQLLECDLNESWVKLEVPQSVMDNGFHAGSVFVDFSGVQ